MLVKGHITQNSNTSTHAISTHLLSYILYDKRCSEEDYVPYKPKTPSILIPHCAVPTLSDHKLSASLKECQPHYWSPASDKTLKTLKGSPHKPYQLPKFHHFNSKLHGKDLEHEQKRKADLTRDRKTFLQEDHQTPITKIGTAISQRNLQIRKNKKRNTRISLRGLRRTLAERADARRVTARGRAESVSDGESSEDEDTRVAQS